MWSWVTNWVHGLAFYWQSFLLLQQLVNFVTQLGLLCAVLLAIDPRSGGPCAVALLAAFTTLIAAQILSGNPQDCACFGSWSSKKISSWDLLRNITLIALGVLATLD